MVCVKGISGTIQVSVAETYAPSITIYGIKNGTISVIGGAVATSSSASFSGYDALIVCAARDRQFTIYVTVTESH